MSKILSDGDLFAKHNTHNTLRILTLNFEDYLTLLKERDAQRVCANCKYHIKKYDSCGSGYAITFGSTQSCTEFEGKV